MSHQAEQTTPVAVVGAGPAGLAAALMVAGTGQQVSLIAPHAPASDGRTSALFGASIGLLERLGVWPKLEEKVAPLRHLRIIDATERLVRAPEVVFSSREIGAEQFGFNIPNRELVAALQAAAACEASIQPVPSMVAEVRFDESGGVLLDLPEGKTVRSEVCVAADGRRSMLRSAAGISTRDWTYDQAALVCNLEHEADHEDTSTEFHTEHGPLTLVPMPGRNSSLVWIDQPSETRRRIESDPGDLADEISERTQRLLGRVRVTSPVQSFPLSGLSVNRYAARGILLVGEAAHAFPPIGAQGLNLSYRDVADLGKLMSSDERDPTALCRRFDDMRRSDAQTRTSAVDALNRSLLSDLLPVQFARGAGLFLLDRVAPLRRWAMTAGMSPESRRPTI